MIKAVDAVAYHKAGHFVADAKGKYNWTYFSLPIRKDGVASIPGVFAIEVTASTGTSLRDHA